MIILRCVLWLLLLGFVGECEVKAVYPHFKAIVLHTVFVGVVVVVERTIDNDGLAFDKKFADSFGCLAPGCAGNKIRL